MHKELKIAAVLCELSMRDLVINSIDRELKRLKEANNNEEKQDYGVIMLPLPGGWVDCDAIDCMRSHPAPHCEGTTVYQMSNSENQ